MQGLENKETANTKSEPAKPLKVVSLALNLGFTIAIPILIFGIGGRLLDRHFDSSPLFLLVGFLLSVIISIVIIYRTVMPFIKS